MRSGVRSSVRLEANASSRHRARQSEVRIDRAGGRCPCAVHFGRELSANVRVVNACKPLPVGNAQAVLVFRGDRSSQLGFGLKMITVDVATVIATIRAGVESCQSTDRHVLQLSMLLEASVRTSRARLSVLGASKSGQVQRLCEILHDVFTYLAQCVSR
jgi:hypothetical protein